MIKLEDAISFDQNDVLNKYRDQFHIPKGKDGNDTIYFCGNSLGLQPRITKSYIEQELEDWKNMGVEGHLHAKNPWKPYHEFLTDQMAKIVGAKPIEVVVMNSLTVNLHLMMASFYRPTPKRHKIVIDYNPFPSDLYAVQSQAAWHGFDPAVSIIILKPEPGSDTVSIQSIKELLEREGDSIAIFALAGVNYYSGQFYDVKTITSLVQAYGIPIGWDMAHAAGNIDLKLHEWGCDFAVWCSYKYLNSGPGSLAGCFVHERHANREDLPKLAGWWGQDKAIRFQMGPEFHAIPGAEGWQMSNPPILSMAAIRASLSIFEEAGIGQLRKKSIQLTNFLAELLLNIDSDRISLITPTNSENRGAQLSIRVKGADKSLFHGLMSQNVISDWREPDVIRIAPTPLYNTYKDAFQFTEILKSLL